MTITLNKQGYDPFIDFLKGWAIICVVITHAINPTIHDASLFFLWGDWAVPLFLMIQVFHTYKKGQPSLILSWLKIAKRIIIPFATITFLMFIIKCGFSEGNFAECVDILKGTIAAGGIGPGSYYPWLYLQFFILLPFLYKTLNNNKLNRGGYLAISILSEILCSVINMPEPIYRLSFIRYIFLIYLGYQWVERGIVINWKTITLSVISIIAISYFNFFDYDLEPIFFSSGWKIFHWICYFYPATILVYLIKKLYDALPQRYIDFTNKCGRYSYEIFLWQMFVFAFIIAALNKIERVMDIPNTYHLIGLFNMVASIVISICPPILYYKYKENIKAK